MSQYFPKPSEPFRRNVKVELNLSSYATKAELKNATVDTSRLAEKCDLAKFKGEVDLNKLSNVVNNDVVKKTVYDQLVANVNNIDTSGFVLKTKYNTDKLNLEKKIPDISGLNKKTDYNAKVSEIESKIRSISGLATNPPLTVENKIPDISRLGKKTGYNKKKTSEIEKKLTDLNHDKYINTSECNRFTAEIFDARLT